MRVKVKDGKKGFYGNALRYGADEHRAKGDVFTLVERAHSTQKDDNGKPVIITVEQQFSDNWMESLEPEKEPKKEKEPTRDEKAIALGISLTDEEGNKLHWKHIDNLIEEAEK
jgi:hypothetical protein